MSATPDRLHLGGLLALAAGSFVTILTEVLPAGLLPQISSTLGVSEALAGQWVSIYALGSLVAAIPLTAATRNWRRRPLLLIAIIGFALANGVTAVSPSFTISLAARFVGGLSAGLLWALLAGYAIRLAPGPLAGRAMAIAMAGTPVALSLGIPLGTAIGNLTGWRMVFGGLSGAALLLASWIALRLPDFPGEPPAHRPSLQQVFVLPGVRRVLLLTLCFVLAHNVLYTFIAPLLAQARMVGQTDRVLLVFGLAGMASIVMTGALIDRHLRNLTRAGIALFASAAILLSASVLPFAVYIAALAWGLGFGGAATVLQTASARAAGRAADVAQAMIVTVWNLAIAGGAILGGSLLNIFGVQSLTWAALALLSIAAATVVRPAVVWRLSGDR
ncbi:MFS transporter [Altericroceibacterium spongiae]|uniref:MFS transporter n=1 Tax=Altericroceibacterium spongiae TaxID=2320269 RepID=A0A420EBY3_9SPHN|nr:MFS transporter [Altericroceibacterium spongiae]RKF18207.1 MFS transporter [Altericroceibacterium spongiae]